MRRRRRRRKRRMELDIGIGGLDGTERQTDHSETGKVFFSHSFGMRKRARNTHSLHAQARTRTHTHSHTYSLILHHDDAKHIDPHHMWLQQQIITLTTSTSFEGRSFSLTHTRAHTHPRVHTHFLACMMVFCCVERELVTHSTLPPPSSLPHRHCSHFQGYFQGLFQPRKTGSSVYLSLCLCIHVCLYYVRTYLLKSSVHLKGVLTFTFTFTQAIMCAHETEWIEYVKREKKRTKNFF